MNNRICKVCGKSYYYCPSCPGDSNKETWHILVHDKNCFDIFTTLQRHFLKEYTDGEAKAALESCDLSVLGKAPDNIKQQAEGILKAAKPRKTRAKKVITEN